MRKHIKNVKVGDRVKVFNLKTSKAEISTVSQTFSAVSDHYYILNGKTKVTGEHPYFVEGGWKRVKNLKVGDRLFHKNGKEVKVKTLEKFDKPMTIYNIEVEGTHNYYADGFLVHNKMGDYHGRDKKPKKQRKRLNNAATNWNNEVPHLANDALSSQGSAANEVAVAMGTMEDFIDPTASQETQAATLGVSVEDLGLDQPKSGEMKTLFNAITDSLKTKRDAKLDAGAQFRDSQKELMASLEKTNMIGAGERLQIEQERTLEAETKEIEVDTGTEINQARSDFEEAKTGMLMDMATSAKEQVADLPQAVKIRGDKLALDWRGATGNYNIRRNVAAHMRTGEASSTRVDTIIPPSGTTLETQIPQNVSASDGGEGQAAVAWMGSLNKDEATMQDTVGMLQKEYPGSVPTFPQPGTDSSNTIFNVWKDVGPDANVGVMVGPNSGNLSSMGNSENYYIKAKKGCFHGSTWIEVHNG